MPGEPHLEELQGNILAGSVENSADITTVAAIVLALFAYDNDTQVFEIRELHAIDQGATAVSLRLLGGKYPRQPDHADLSICPGDGNAIRRLPHLTATAELDGPAPTRALPQLGGRDRFDAVEFLLPLRFLGRSKARARICDFGDEIAKLIR